ncbi:MAG: glycine cleavage system H protein [Rhodothermales bacterium]|jgi:glycine cleavage system H protein
MLMNPQKLRFSEHHLWISVDQNDIATVGFSEEMEARLTGLTSLELPIVGDELEHEHTCLVVHRDDELIDVVSPLSGRVVDSNVEMEDNPELIFASPYEHGWLYKMEIDVAEELDNLVSHDEYAVYAEHEPIPERQPTRRKVISDDDE